MIITQLSSFFGVKGNLVTDTPGAQGAIEKSFTSNLSDLALDSLYTKLFIPAEINSLPWRYYSFPTVDRTINGTGAVVEDGDDRQPLLLNSVHAIAIDVVADTGGTPSGYITVSLKKVGGAGATAAVHKLEPGEGLMVQTRYGWPAHADTEIIITGSTLVDAKVSFALVGHTANTGTGYA